jgi:hypothetical protein
LLENLLRSENPVIRGRACVVMAEPPRLQRGCLAALVSDPAALPTDRARARELINTTPKM